MFAVVCVFLAILHGASSAENKNVVEELSSAEQPSFRIGRRMGALAEDDFSTSVSNNGVTNKGTCTMADRLEPGFARKGEAFRKTAASDAAECALFCEFVAPSCVAINYRDSDKACFFLAYPGYIYVASGYTTALVKPSLSNVCAFANMVVGYTRAGAGVPGNPRTVSSATECCMLCYATSGCIAYSVRVHSSNCWLKTVVAPKTKASGVTGIVCLK